MLFLLLVNSARICKAVGSVNDAWAKVLYAGVFGAVGGPLFSFVIFNIKAQLRYIKYALQLTISLS
jgi:hypothetical protein